MSITQPRKCQAKDGPSNCTANDCPEKQDYQACFKELDQTSDYNEYSKIRDQLLKMEKNNPLLKNNRPTPNHTPVKDLKPGTKIGGGTVIRVFHRHPQPRNKRTVILEKSDGKQITKEWGAYTKISHWDNS